MAIVRHILLLLVALALGCIWLASAAGNFAHGTQLAGASPYWWVYGLSSASADVLKATALLGLTPAWRARWGWGSRSCAVTALLLIFALSAGWGVRSSAGFISTTLSDTVSSRDLQGVADASLKTQIDNQVAQVTKLQDLKVKSPPSHWERIEGEIALVEKRIDKLRKQARNETGTGAADPLGDLLKRWVEPDTTRLGTVILFLLLIEVVSSAGLMAFAPLLGIDYNKIADMLSGDQVQKLERKRPPPRKVEEPAEPVEPALSTAGPKLRLVPQSPLRVQAIEFLDALTTKHGAGTAVPTHDVFDAYRAMAREKGWDAMASNKLGGQLQNLGVRKQGDAKAQFYVLPKAKREAPGG